jgi:hypothetical protein
MEAEGLLFPANDGAIQTTGQFFVVDGGQLAGQKPWLYLLNHKTYY